MQDGLLFLQDYFQNVLRCVWSYFLFFLRVCLEETIKGFVCKYGYIESALSFKQAINGHWSQLPYETSSNKIVLLKWQPNALILKFCSKLTYILKRVTLFRRKGTDIEAQSCSFHKIGDPHLNALSQLYIFLFSC